MNPEIIAYYDQLALSYDQDRFGNSYGRFVDARERTLIERWLAGRRKVLEIACGTGRLSNLAHVACDASQESLKVARARDGKLPLAVADAMRLPFASASFDAVFGFHLLMHFDLASVRATIAEASRVLQPGGVLILDVVSKTRRRLHSRPAPPTAWHGSMSLTVGEFRGLCAEQGLQPLRMTGLLLVPVQRLPHWLRPHLTMLDAALSSVLPSLSSSLIGCFVKP
jgi:SAM-dependent methyltransferase